MKSTRRVLVVLIVLSLLTFSIPFGNVNQMTSKILSFQGVAIAANQTNNEEEPFAKKSEVVADPLEPMNRVIFQINDKLYFWVLKPASKVLSWYLPPGVRICIRNAFDNVLMPMRVVSNTLQGKLDATGTEFARFAINSTMGLGGMFDVASRNFNINKRDEDFGQTLGVWGMKHVVYVHWPLLGPSSLRDTLGMTVDAFLNPITYLAPDFWVSAGIRAGRAVNNSSLRIGEYEDFKKSALDPYISMRDAYIQYRAEELQR